MRTTQSATSSVLRNPSCGADDASHGIRAPTNHGSRRERAYGEEQKPLCAQTMPAPAFEAEPLGAHMQPAVEVPQNPAPDWTHEAVFASERQSAARARSFVSSRLVDHRLLRLVDPVRAVTSELSANAIVHARTPFAVTLSRTGPVVLLSVQDTAPDSPAIRCSVQVMAEGAEPRRHPQPLLGRDHDREPQQVRLGII